VGFEGDRDLHGFTGENQTLLNRWDTSLLLDLLFDFRDLLVSSIRITSPSSVRIIAASGVIYRDLFDGDGDWIMTYGPFWLNVNLDLDVS